VSAEAIIATKIVVKNVAVGPESATGAPGKTIAVTTQAATGVGVVLRIRGYAVGGWE
jgi:hypothetical protein